MSELNVLFMQSQSYFGSDSMIHSLIMQHLNRSRVNVHVACNRGKGSEKSPALRALEQIPNLHVRPTEFGVSINAKSPKELISELTSTGPFLWSIAGLVSYVRKHNIQIIHGTEKPRDAFYGYLLGRLTGAKTITHLHVKVEDWISPLTRYAMHRNDGLIAVSEFVAQSAVDMGYDQNSVYYALNSVEASRWDPNTDGSGVRAEFGIAPDVPVFAICARVFPWKGHAELLRALAIVKKTNPRFKLLLVGEDDPRATPGGGSFIADLRKLAAELQLEEQVVFTGFRRDIQQLLAATDVYTMPTFEEPCAVAFLEALAMRKPVVALDSGGTPQLVDHGKSGLLSKPKDIEGLARNLLEVMSDPELRKRMGDHARRRVEEYYTPQRLADEIEKIYRDIVGIETAPRELRIGGRPAASRSAA